jgi:hypothetical protein
LIFGLVFSQKFGEVSNSSAIILVTALNCQARLFLLLPGFFLTRFSSYGAYILLVHVSLTGKSSKNMSVIVPQEKIHTFSYGTGSTCGRRSGSGRNRTGRSAAGYRYSSISEASPARSASPFQLYLEFLALVASPARSAWPFQLYLEFLVFFSPLNVTNVTIEFTALIIMTISSDRGTTITTIFLLIATVLNSGIIFEFCSEM